MSPLVGASVSTLQDYHCYEGFELANGIAPDGELVVVIIDPDGFGIEVRPGDRCKFVGRDAPTENCLQKLVPDRIYAYFIAYTYKIGSARVSAAIQGSDEREPKTDVGAN